MTQQKGHDGPQTRVLGVTVLTDFLLNEGVDGILDQLEHIGANAVATNPTVTCESVEGVGSFQPPTDAGSSPRLFDRPLWGKRALWVQSAPSFHPQSHLYKGMAYGPRKTSELTDKYGSIVGEFIRKAADRGLAVYLQLGSAQPTGLCDEDRPRLPNGAIPDRMADTASLASSAVWDYNRAYLKDLLTHYPEITGIRLDWPEYPCYKFDEIFVDFSSHVRGFAEDRGFDFESIRREIDELWRKLQQGPDNRLLAQIASPERGAFLLHRLSIHFPYFHQWLRLKAALSTELIHQWRDALEEAGGSEKQLSVHAFMPPYTLLTGFDFTEASRCVHSISPKLYTMHWSQMVDFWGKRLLQPGVDEQLLTRSLVSLMDLDDPANAHSLSDYGYPEPDEPHPIPDEPQQRKIGQVLSAVDGRVPVWPLVHGYGPLDDFTRRFRVVANSEADGVWINRYGYLSDEKLAAIGDIWKHTRP